MDKLANDYSYRTIAAHGLAVGLSDGLMGNSEVGSVEKSSLSSGIQWLTFQPKS
jgi:bisphosphoglycerate-independent phosphoglycerate mutase (AlkP superfamily)